MNGTTEDLLAKLNRRSVDPDSPTPLYYQLYTMLHDAICSGVLTTGSKMPSEKELASAFKVSRITARRALDELALKNMVLRHRGRGTFVDYHYQPDPIHAPLSDLMDSLDHMARDTHVSVLGLRFEKPPSTFRELFELGAKDKLCHIVRIRSKDAVPFAHYVTWTRGFDRSLTRKKLEARPRIKLFKDYGIIVSRVEQFLSAEGASPEVADALVISSGKPLLRLQRYSYDADGQLMDVLAALYNPDLFRYKMETVLD